MKNLYILLFGDDSRFFQLVFRSFQKEGRQPEFYECIYLNGRRYLEPLTDNDSKRLGYIVGKFSVREFDFDKFRRFIEYRGYSISDYKLKKAK